MSSKPNRDSEPAARAIQPDDPALPAIRARLAALLWQLWQARVLDGGRLPLAPAPADPPALWLVAAVWRRLRLHLLAGELFDDILPAIERWLASTGRHQLRPAPLGTPARIDWPASWRRSLEDGRQIQETIVTRHWRRHLDLPENRLVALALATLADDASATLSEALPAPERHAISTCARQAARTLSRPPWNSLVERTAGVKAGGSSASHLSDEPRAVAAQAAVSIRRLPPPQRRMYARLLDWWERYQAWRQTRTGAVLLPTSEVEADLLFELLVLFELVTALARHVPVIQSRHLTGPAADPTRPLFQAHHPAGELAIFYQTGSMFAQHRRLAAIWGIPDIVIRLPGERFVILDAKNYASTRHSEALYKLMGYLYNFGYNPRFLPNRPPAEALFQSFERIAAGAIVFPSPEREGRGLHAWHSPAAGGQAVFSLVLPPLPDERYRGLEEFVAWLLREASRATPPGRRES